MSMQLSSWAIRRPIPTIVLFLVLAIAGWTSFSACRSTPIRAWIFPW